MNQYTVILMYPGEDPVQTYRADVEASSPREAVQRARGMATAENGFIYDTNDFEVLLVTAGWINEVMTERYT